MELCGRKLGMTQVFTDDGERVPVTVIRLGPCIVIQKKSPDSDGYAAVQLGFEDRKDKHTTKAQAGHFARAGVSPKRHLFEVRVEADALEGIEVGQAFDVSEFEAGQRVDATGTSRGRGFSGVIKRHNYATARATHGTHEMFRHGGAMSAGTYPGRIWKGKKMAGHMGDEQVTTLGLKVERVDTERGLLFVRGGVPGAKNGLIRVRPTVRA